MIQTEPLPSNDQSLSLNELEQAFEVFSRVSVELDTTYRDLESKVGGLTAELNAARSARLKELAEKERIALRLSSLVAALPGGVLILDAMQEIRDANPEAVQLLGEPLLGQAWSDVLFRESGERKLESRELRLKNGMRFSVDSRKLDEQGEQVVLITDVSQMHELQEQLGRKKRLTALGEMAARLAHQIRTPLSSTTLYLSHLGRQDLSPLQRENIASKVGSRLSHMGKLVDSMLSFVKGETPSTELIFLDQVLRDFASTVQPQLAASRSTLSVPEVDNTLALIGNQDELTGALCNLAMNAIEAADDPIELQLWVGALNEHWLQIRVRDNGPGIADDILDRIFDPFFTTRAQGTGLGLAVVAMTVANHGGEICAKNISGGGVEFIIDLPIEEPETMGTTNAADFAQPNSDSSL
ncbi:MAG: PAS domain-containing sensor histidine kinase [Halioglobus sp.]